MRYQQTFVLNENYKMPMLNWQIDNTFVAGIYMYAIFPFVFSYHNFLFAPSFTRLLFRHYALRCEAKPHSHHSHARLLTGSPFKSIILQIDGVSEKWWHTHNIELRMRMVNHDDNNHQDNSNSTSAGVAKWDRSAKRKMNRIRVICGWRCLIQWTTKWWNFAFAAESHRTVYFTK